MPSRAIASCLSTALLLTAGSAHARAQETREVWGSVTDSGSSPIPYVSVDGGPRHRTLSSGAGQFTLRVPANESIRLTVRRIGFLPGTLDLVPGGDTALTIVMQPLAVLMETQMVRARAQVRGLAARGFYERMAEREYGSLVGEFVTPEEIELRNPQRATQLLEQRRGVWIKRVGRCHAFLQCYRVLGSNDCVATVYLDGTRLNSLSDPAAAGADKAPAIDELISPTSISAMEVYPRGSSAPARYQSLGGTCAVIVIWTK